MTAPQWGRLAAGRLVEPAEQFGGNALEQYAAQVRDQLDRWGITLTDTEAVYCALAGQRVLLEIMAVARLQGEACAGSIDAAIGAHNGILAALLPYLPEEARR